MYEETDPERIRRQEEAIANLPHEDGSIEQAAAIAARDFWPETPQEILEDLTRDLKDALAHRLDRLKAGCIMTTDRGKPGLPAVRRELDRDRKDPETGLPEGFISSYNRRVSGRYGGGEYGDDDGYVICHTCNRPLGDPAEHGPGRCGR